MAEQISDKQKGLLNSPVKNGERSGLEKHLWEEGEHQDDVGSHGEGELKSHYRKVILEWLISFPFFQAVYRKVIEGEKDPALPIADASKNCYSCLFAKSTMAKDSLMQKHQEACPLGPPKRWMKKRAVQRGQFLYFQWLFHTDRGKLASIIPDDVESLRCSLPTRYTLCSSQDGNRQEHSKAWELSRLLALHTIWHSKPWWQQKRSLRT